MSALRWMDSFSISSCTIYRTSQHTASALLCGTVHSWEHSRLAKAARTVQISSAPGCSLAKTR